MGSKYLSRHIKLHIFSKFSRGIACPLACVQLISLIFYMKGTIFSFRMQSKYTLKRINYDMFFKNFPGAITNLIKNKSL